MRGEADEPAGEAERGGPFWDVIEGRAAPPPAAVLLGFELVSIDPQAGTIEVAFNATEQFLNPAGTIQGGLLAAMLDDTLGPALGTPAAAMRVPKVCRSEWKVIPPSRPQRWPMFAASIAAWKRLRICEAS